VKFAIILLLDVCLLLGTACVPGKPRYDDPEKPAGFWSGVWHGLIVVITMIWQFFNPQIRIYEVNNNGWPYDLGFVLAVIAIFSGGRASHGSNRH
jgi:hypothetical protein